MNLQKPIILPEMKVGHMNPATDYAMSSDNSDDDEDICYELPSAREA